MACKPKAPKVVTAHERCLHFGLDCKGPMQTEHITYAPDTKAPICAFHNQVLRVMRRSLALSKMAVSLKAKLTVRQRIHTIEVLRQHLKCSDNIVSTPVPWQRPTLTATTLPRGRGYVSESSTMKNTG